MLTARKVSRPQCAWSKDEDEKLVAAYKKYGNSWSSIAKEVTHRTSQQCRSRMTNYHDEIVAEYGSSSPGRQGDDKQASRSSTALALPAYLLCLPPRAHNCCFNRMQPEGFSTPQPLNDLHQ